MGPGTTIARSHQAAPLTRQPNGLAALIILIAVFLPGTGVCQKKVSLQVKTFDQSMKPVSNIEISLNDSGYFMIGSKGTAVVELNESDAKIISVRVKDETIEPASWNVSKGVVEIVIRPKSHRVLHFILRLPDGKGVPGASITYQGSLTIKSKSDPAGRFVLQVPLKERVGSADQFRVQEFQVVGLTLSETESILNVVKPKPQPQLPEPVVQRPKQSVPLQTRVPQVLNTGILDTVSSLASFYAMIRTMPMSNLTAKERNILDTKFKAMLAKERAMLTAQEEPANMQISETSTLDEDVDALQKEAVSENNTLQTRQSRFEDQASVLSQKLDTAITGKSEVQRAGLLAEIDSLERLFVASETAFNQYHNDRREIINALREKYWNIQPEEADLSDARQRDQQQSRQRLLGIAAIIVAIASLVILLIILYSRLRERTLALQHAKRKIKEDKENTDDVVTRQTRLLSESNREINSFLNRSSRELRALLRSIIGLYKVIEEMPSRELVGRVETATDRMDRVLSKLIDISEIGQESGKVEQVKLLDVINKVKNKHLSAAGLNHAGEPVLTRSLKFNVKCDDDVTLYADRSLLEILLDNLVENAILFSTIKDEPGPAIVEVAVVTRGDMVEMSVYDNGVGISSAMKPKVFNMFFTGSEEARGGGLGLYAVRKVVLALHGKVDIMTEEGVFTRVVVMVPRGQQTVRKVTKDIRQPIGV